MNKYGSLDSAANFTSDLWPISQQRILTLELVLTSRPPCL